uniref:OTU domain-containing protein n=1 Tax=Physcomitrium patens TaxID=3218 RepID=A0A7I4BHT7_PHYPA
MGQKRTGLRMRVSGRRHKDKVLEIASLNEQLSLLGLKVVPVTADGNCFFRAVADQLEGAEEQHSAYRQKAVDYLQEHREDFEPFLEDGIPFDNYLKTMRENCVWAGHMEIQATSLVTRTNICIHQLKTPRWHIRNFNTADTKTIHLSYHDGEHYNSIRRQDDPGICPALPFIIEGDATPATQPPPIKTRSFSRDKGIEAATMKSVMERSGCTSETRVREVLRDVRGDADAATEYLIAEMSGDASSSCSYESDSGSPAATSDQSSFYGTSISGEDDSARSLVSSTINESEGGTGIFNDSSASSKSVGRNKPCPCGSRRKYKACCGTSRTRMTLAYMSRAEESIANRLRRQKQKITMGYHHTSNEEMRHLQLRARFLVLSLLLGVTVLINTGLTYGGTITFTWGWFICGFFNLHVAFAMAEQLLKQICSAFPTSGGLYFWSAQLASPEWKPFASWITGWFNVAGQWAGTCSVSFALFELLSVMALLATGGANGGGYLMNKYEVVGINGVILFSTGLLNCMPIQYLDYLSPFSAAWQLIGTFLLIIILPSVATKRQSISFVFTSFYVPTDLKLPSRPYIFLLGLIINQYVICGYDASAHMAEETKASDRDGALGILSSVVATLVVGITSNSRMAYDFSRDGALPLSKTWQKVNRHEVPVNAVWLSAPVAFVMMLPSLGNLVAFQAMTSIATTGNYISYALPILIHITAAHRTFVPGPINLGPRWWSLTVGWVAVLWVATITVLFSLPVRYPSTLQFLNYTPIAVGGLFLLVVSYWLLSARNWFKSPQHNYDQKKTAEELVD